MVGSAACAPLTGACGRLTGTCGRLVTEDRLVTGTWGSRFCGRLTRGCWRDDTRLAARLETDWGGS